MDNRYGQQITLEDLNNLSTTGNRKDIKIGKVTYYGRLTFSGKVDSEMQEMIEKAHWEAINLVVGKTNNGEKINQVNSLVLDCELNTRMRTKGGDASFSKKRIRLNYRLHKDNMDQVLETYLHELAHILNYILYPKHKKSHGWEWKDVMSLLERNPEVYHKMDTSKYKRKVKRYHYSCSCGKTHEMTKGKHWKVQNGYTYACRESKEVIKASNFIGSPEQARSANFIGK